MRSVVVSSERARLALPMCPLLSTSEAGCSPISTEKLLHRSQQWTRIEYLVLRRAQPAICMAACVLSSRSLGAQRRLAGHTVSTLHRWARHVDHAFCIAPQDRKRTAREIFRLRRCDVRTGSSSRELSGSISDALAHLAYCANTSLSQPRPECCTTVRRDKHGVIPALITPSRPDLSVRPWRRSNSGRA